MRTYFRIYCFVVAFFLLPYSFGTEKQSLVERLGYDKDAKLLIVNADDFGMCHSANRGTFKAFESGGISSATIMVTCPWFLEAAQWLENHQQYDVGLHTVLTSEWGIYKWGPVAGTTEVPSLCTSMGYFPAGIAELYLKGKSEEVETELRAQIARALRAKIDLTHLDAHMGAAQLHPIYLSIYAKLGNEFQLPCRMPSREALDRELNAGSVLDQFEKLGVICPDELLRDSAPKVSELESFWKKRLSNLRPGYVTEVFIHCADDSAEMKAFTSSHGIRFAETEFFSDHQTVQWIKDQGIIIISYRPLRDLQRSEAGKMSMVP